jgi:hypothetical protein
MKHVNTVCKKNTMYLKAAAGGTCSDCWCTQHWQFVKYFHFSFDTGVLYWIFSTQFRFVYMWRKMKDSSSKKPRSSSFTKIIRINRCDRSCKHDVQGKLHRHFTF